MKGIASSCIPFLVVFALQQGVTAWKPKMTPEVDELLIQEGDELKIECKGEGRINFSKQNFAAYSAHRIWNEQSNFTESFDKASGTYTFIRPRTTRQDAGWYACAEEGIQIRNDEQTIEHPSDNINWIYVYVNSSMPFSVNVPVKLSIMLMEGSDFVIPCRPTSPILPVILESSDLELPVPENTQYDPRIGFILKAVGKEYYLASYKCKREGYTNYEIWPSYYVFVESIAIQVGSNVNNHTPPHVVWGQDVSLVCLITLNDANSVSINWTVPSSILEERLRYSWKVLFRPDYLQTKIWFAAVTIKNVERNDDGEYICTAKDENDYQIKSSTKIKFWDPDYVYIDVSVIGEKETLVTEYDIAKWVVKIDTRPKNFTLKWYREDGTLITTDANYSQFEKYRHHQLGMTHWFTISHLSAEDSGKYTVRVSTSHNETSIVLSLSVVGKPSIRMGNILLFYSPGVTVDFNSQILASSSPNVTWRYVEYPDFPSQLNSTLILLSNLHKAWLDKPPFHFTSHVNFTINLTGDLICRSCNYIGCTEDTQKIIVSDVPGFFAIRDPGMITEGDDINLTCGASIYNYTDSVEWGFKDFREQEFNSERINITKQKTKFTWQSIIHIRNVSQSDSGRYTCTAVDNKRHRDRVSYQLRLEAARAPEFTYTNMNNSEIFIDQRKDKKKTVLLECRAEGRPIPKITWHKNNELLKESTWYRFSKDNTKLQIAYFSGADTDSGRYACKAVNRIGTAEKYMDIKIKGNSVDTTIWVSLFCILIVIIIIVITYAGIKVRRKRALREELLDAGLTHFEEGALKCLNPDLTVDDQAELLPYDKKWEFPWESLKLGKQLGSGAFGVVMKAEAQGIIVDGEITTVAVKMVRRSADPSYIETLSNELKIMIHMGRHLNVVNLLGACTKAILTKRELYVIVEYCRHGNLHDYLLRHRASFIDQIDPSTGKIDTNIGIESSVGISKSTGRQNGSSNEGLSLPRSISVKSSNRNSGINLDDYHQCANWNETPDSDIVSDNLDQPGWRSNYHGDYEDVNLKPIRTEDLLCWAWQVSCGMEYLSSRNIVHGGLEARNILLAENNVVKICDFRLARNIYKGNNYKKTKDGPLPIKWMAIESITDQIFSTQSDVWSFGIVLWEFFTLSHSPYPGMEFDKQYVDRLIEGYRMEKPEYATKEIYDLMLHCWEARPSMRPRFSELVEKIGTLLNEGVKQHYLDLNTPYKEMNTTAIQNGQTDHLSMMSAPDHGFYNLPDPMSEKPPDSAYLSVSSLNKTNQPDIFSPRSAVEEPRFNFPSSSKNIPINSNSETCIECVPMLRSEDAHMKSIDVRQRRAQFVNETEIKL